MNNDYLSRKFREIEEAGRPSREMTAKHAADCFAPYQCMSCGCDRTGKWSGEVRPCVSHLGHPAYMAHYMAHLAERQAKAQERIAAAQEQLISVK